MKNFKENGYTLIRVVFDTTLNLAHKISKNYIPLSLLKELINKGIDNNGNINLEIFNPYDFNKG